MRRRRGLSGRSACKSRIAREHQSDVAVPMMAELRHLAAAVPKDFEFMGVPNFQARLATATVRAAPIRRSASSKVCMLQAKDRRM